MWRKKNAICKWWWWWWWCKCEWANCFYKGNLWSVVFFFSVLVMWYFVFGEQQIINNRNKQSQFLYTYTETDINYTAIEKKKYRLTQNKNSYDTEHSGCLLLLWIVGALKKKIHSSTQSFVCVLFSICSTFFYLHKTASQWNFK